MAKKKKIDESPQKRAQKELTPETTEHNAAKESAAPPRKKEGAKEATGDQAEKQAPSGAPDDTQAPEKNAGLKAEKRPSRKGSGKKREKKTAPSVGRETDLGYTKSWSEKAKPIPGIVRFPIVAIGASAGGLEAFEQFFMNMPSDSGMAFVLIQHLDPTHKSILAELIRRYTRMEVFQIEDGMIVKPDCVYVIPPNSYLAILNGKLHLLELTELPGLRMPIDYFFRSLAEDQKEKSICIVMSGTGTEGTLGLRTIKGEGGLGMVQDPATAKYDGMPRSAIATGLPDFVLPADRMPAQLIDYLAHATAGRVESVKIAPRTADLLEKVFILVREHTGQDFSLYKRNTILRRIERRMAINRVRKLDDYVRFLQKGPEEAAILFKELLIGVTSFFRDPEAFQALKERGLRKILQNRSKNEAIRIWVPGCATGEEAYSVAMLAKECMEELQVRSELQVFGTDIDADAIEIARAGVYPQSISVDLSEERLTRCFNKEDSSFRVKKEVRDKLVFAVQNVVSDPPFSRLDLVSCRNLMIYLTAELQRKLVPLFHYSLRPGGFLFLGTAETVGEFSDLFSTVDRKWKLFRCRETELSAEEVIDLHSLRHHETKGPRPESRFPGAPVGINYREAVEKLMLESYSPSGVVINEHSEILYVHGKTGKYLEPAPGSITMNVVSMAREGLRLELASAIRKATGMRQEIRRDRLTVKTDGGEQLVNLVVRPLSEPPAMGGMLLAIFEDASEEPPAISSYHREASPEDSVHPRVQELEQELKANKEYLQSTIEELETSNEELKSTNEELQSSNEELQSSNEELETSKEELQSVNEELATVNTELQQKIEDLSKANSDMSNLLASTQVATMFLDTGLLIRRFTPKMTDLIPLIQSDVGRPVEHVATKLRYDRLVEDAREALRTLVPIETEIRAKDERWYAMRVLPYRTITNVIDGVVITFMEITKLKEALEEVVAARKREAVEAESRREYCAGIVEMVREPLLVLDNKLRVRSANAAFYRVFQVKREETEGELLYHLGNGQWDIPRFRELLEEVLPKQTTIEDFKVEHGFDEIGKRTMLLNARQVVERPGDDELILLAIEDITDTVKT